MVSYVRSGIVCISIGCRWNWRKSTNCSLHCIRSLELLNFKFFTQLGHEIRVNLMHLDYVQAYLNGI
jgi:hypothetical protein